MTSVTYAHMHRKERPPAASHGESSGMRPCTTELGMGMRPCTTELGIGMRPCITELEMGTRTKPLIRMKNSLLTVVPGRIRTLGMRVWELQLGNESLGMRVWE